MISTREEASAEAQRRFGNRAVVGHGRPTPNNTAAVYYVGWKEFAAWQWLGTGATWDEAFANVKQFNRKVR